MAEDVGFIEEEQAPTPSVPIRLPDGAAATVPAADLDQAIRAGATLRDVNADAYDAAMKQKVSGVGGGLMAAAAGLLRTPTLGLSDKALVEGRRALYGDEAADSLREELGAYKEYQSGASTLGGLVGLLAPTGLAGGVGRAGAAVRGITSVPRGISALGGAAEGAAARLLGQTAQSALGRAMQTGVALGARGAAEGALFGAGEAYSEAVLGDHELNAEKLFAGAEKGALFGGALGGALGVGGSLVASTGRGLASLVNRARPSADELGAVAQAEAKAAGAAAGADAKVGAAIRQEMKLEAELEMSGMKLGQTPEAMSEARAAINEVAEQAAAKGGAKLADDAAEAFISKRFADNAELADLHRRMYRDRAKQVLDYDDELNTLTRSVSGDGQALLNAEKRLYELTAQEKPEQIARLVNSKNMSGAHDTWQAVMEDAQSTVRFLRESGETGAIVGKGEAALKKFATKIEKIRTGSPEEYVKKAYIAIDNFKREIGQAAKFGTRLTETTPAAQTFDDLYKRIIPTLENESVWGAAGAAQREINQATAKALSTKRVFEGNFVTQYGSEAGRAEFVFDPAKVKSYLTGLGGAEKDIAKRSLEDYFAGIRGRIEAAERHYKPSSRQATSFAEAKAAIGRLEKTIASAEKNASEINQIRKLQQIEKDSSLGGILAGAGGMLAMGGGLIPGLAAVVGGAAMRPMQTLAGLAKVRSALDKVDDAIRKGAEGVTSRVNVKIASDAEAVSHASAKAAAKSVAENVGNPARMQTIVERMLGGGDIATMAPNISASFAATATRAATYLASQAPQGHAPTTLVLGDSQKEPRYSASDLDAFAAKIAVIKNPMVVFAEAKRGTLNRDKIEALKAVYPKLYQQMGAQVMRQIAELDAKGTLDKTLSYQTRIALGMMLGIPADDTLKPDFVRAMQERQPVNAAPQQGQKTRAMRIDSQSYQTATERIAS